MLACSRRLCACPPSCEVGCFKCELEVWPGALPPLCMCVHVCVWGGGEAARCADWWLALEALARAYARDPLPMAWVQAHGGDCAPFHSGVWAALLRTFPDTPQAALSRKKRFPEAHRVAPAQHSTGCPLAAVCLDGCPLLLFVGGPAHVWAHCCPIPTPPPPPPASPTPTPSPTRTLPCWYSSARALQLLCLPFD
jgi:hypothetical protein